MKLFGVGARIIAVSYLALCAACGGGSGDSGSGGGSPPPPPAGIGAAGGTVAGPSGAQVVIPAGALTTNIQIAVAQSDAGAPALPANTGMAGLMFAFTPHGTAFTTPVTISVPFDPAAVPVGLAPILYKTNAAMTAFEAVPGATVSGSVMSGQVNGFSVSFVGFAKIVEHPELTEKSWQMIAGEAYEDDPPIVLENTAQVGGEVKRRQTIGDPLIFAPAGQPLPGAVLEVFSSENGKTFSTIAQAPNAPFGQDPQINSTQTGLLQTFTFQRPPGAAPTLKFVLSSAFMEAMDGGGAVPSLAFCPWLDPTMTPEALASLCADYMMRAEVDFTLKATKSLAPEPFFSTGGRASLAGVGQTWNVHVTTPADVMFALWQHDDFTLTTAGDDRHALAELNTPFTVNVPVQGNVGDNETFTVVIEIRSSATNRAQGETYVGAYIRDPLDDDGLQMDFTGLQQIPVDHSSPPAPTPQPCGQAADPAAGTLQFAGGDLSAPEGQHYGEIYVERTGGTTGEVSVQLDSADGSAVAGADYQSTRTVVRFGDGQGGVRTVRIPLVDDSAIEAKETLGLSLSMFKGCAALGARTTATLSILDDDTPVPVTRTFTLSGTVSGLVGSGLVVQAQNGNRVEPTADGAFTFFTPLITGTAYNVVIGTQPDNPAQICTVTNGSGTIADANVTNILVACTTPAANGGLDPGFGTLGKVYDPNLSASAVALQADGKLLTIGRMTLSRYNADGTLDSSFGTAGRVTIVADGNANDTAHGLTIQPDGKILVVGQTSLPTVPNIRWFMQRFNPDGDLDTTFGTGGKVFTDFGIFTDDARTVIVQPGGKILVAGGAVFGPLGLANEDFTVVRYMSDGTLDDQFGFHGVASKDLGGKSEFVSAAALQADGSIVVTGRVFTDNGSGNSDFGVVRFLADGSSDLTFGGDGIVRYDFGEGGDVPVDFDGGDWDVPIDILIQPDGKIVIAGYTGITNFTLISKAAVVRLTTFGLADPTFGTVGLATFDGLTEANSVAVQADGKIVLVGRSSGDFGIARLTDTGAVDTAFGTNGLLRADFFGGSDTPNDVLVQPDGKIVAVGAAKSGSSGGLGMVRIAP